MNNDFDRILDECIDRINRGDNPADCLSDYPEYAERLRPLLQSMYGIKEVYTFTPSADAERKSRQKFYAALDRRRARTPVPVFLRLISRPVTWVAVAAVLALVIIGTAVIRPALTTPTLVSNTEGNFAFLISDEPNDIGDFENLYVTINKVGLQDKDSGKWIEFEPETKTVDLTQLLGEQSQEIWRGDVPEGQYSQVFIYVSKVSGKLEATGQTIDVKLPSSKLQMSKPFEITADTITSFTFDITVISAGNQGKYILKPEIGESGVQQEPKPAE